MATFDKDLTKARSNIANGNVDPLKFTVAAGTGGVTSLVAPRGYEATRTGVGEYTIVCPSATYAAIIASSSEDANLGVDYSTVEDGYFLLVAPADPVGEAFINVAVFLGDVS